MLYSFKSTGEITELCNSLLDHSRKDTISNKLSRDLRLAASIIADLTYAVRQAARDEKQSETVLRLFGR